MVKLEVPAGGLRDLITWTCTSQSDAWLILKDSVIKWTNFDGKETFSQSLRVKKKNRCMIHKDFQKNLVERDLSLCVVENFSGFDITEISQEDKIRQEFTLVNIVYQSESVKHFKLKVNYYFANMLHLAYRTLLARKK